MMVKYLDRILDSSARPIETSNTIVDYQMNQPLNKTTKVDTENFKILPIIIKRCTDQGDYRVKNHKVSFASQNASLDAYRKNGASSTLSQKPPTVAKVKAKIKNSAHQLR